MIYIYNMINHSKAFFTDDTISYKYHILSLKSKVERCRPFGLLFWGLDPIYNVFS